MVVFSVYCFLGSEESETNRPLSQEKENLWGVSGFLVCKQYESTGHSKAAAMHAVSSSCPPCWREGVLGYVSRLYLVGSSMTHFECVY